MASQLLFENHTILYYNPLDTIEQVKSLQRTIKDLIREWKLPEKAKKNLHTDDFYGMMKLKIRIAAVTAKRKRAVG